MIWLFVFLRYSCSAAWGIHPGADWILGFTGKAKCIEDIKVVRVRRLIIRIGSERKQLATEMIKEWQDDTELLRKLLDPNSTYRQAVALIEQRGTASMVAKNWTLPKEGMYAHVKSIAFEFQLLKFVEVLATIKRRFNHQRQKRKNLLREMGLSSPEPTGWFLEANRIPIYKVAVQSQENQYPPHNHWVYEQEEIGEQWRTHLLEGKMKDKRNHRYPLHLLDSQKLQLDIPANESAIFIDSATGKLVGLVVRNFSGGSTEVLQWATSVALEATEWQKSVRVSPLTSSAILSCKSRIGTTIDFGWTRPPSTANSGQA